MGINFIEYLGKCAINICIQIGLIHTKGDNMSNHKHLADLLKVCSILPALAIMPAMAEVVTETGAFDKPVSFISKLDGVEVPRDGSPNGLIRVLNMTEGSYSYDEEKNFMTVAPSDDGKITAQNLFVGIQNQTPDKVAPAIKVEGDENTVLTLTSDKSGVYPLVSRFAKLNIGSEANALGEVNLINNVGGAVMYITDAVTDSNKAGQGHVGNQELNIYANKVLIKTEGTAITGNEGKLTLVANDTLDIIGDIGGYNDVYGGKSHMIMDINNNEGNTAKTTIVGDINAAMGSVLNIGLKGQGSSVTGNMLVSANGEKLPGGGINLHFGDKGTVTGNINAEFEGNVDIDAGDEFVMTGDVSAGNIAVEDDMVTADVDETKAASAGTIVIAGADELAINGKVFATTDGSSIDIQGSDIEIESETDGVLASQKATINVGTEGAKEIEIAATADGRGARADNGATLNIGSDKTETVDITTGNNYAVMALYLNSKVNIDGKYINIANNASGKGAVHVGVNAINPDHDYKTSATVNIEGDNIVITNDATDGTAVAAMSQGVVNIIGNATIKADTAIVARGEAQVNINKEGDKVVKMLGNIDFNYDKATSGSKVDAFVDVTLAGAESFWTGNTVASYGTGKAPDESYLKVSSSKLTMKDGAVWNATKVVDTESLEKGSAYAALNDLVIDGGTVNIADTERGIFVDRIVANDATFNGGMLNVNETINIMSGTTVFNSAVLGDAGVLNLAEGATLDIGTSTVDLAELNINGTVLASVLSDRSYGSLNGAIVAGENGKVQLNVGSEGSYKIFDSQADITVTAGATYDVSQEADGTVVIATKAVEDIAADTGLTTQAAGAIAGLANSDSSKMQQVSLALQEVLNSGDVKAVESETAKLNPTDKPVVQAATASVQNQVLSLAAGRMAGGAAMGRAGGDIPQENGFWMQGLFNKSKLANQFHGYTRGVAFGFDTLIDGKYTLGSGLAINDSDVHSNERGHTEIDSKTMFLYGQYKPSEWFVNAAVTYSMAEYTEQATVAGYVLTDEYDVDSYGAQVMAGYDFDTGVTTEFGVRYLHIAQEDYTKESGATVSAVDTDVLTTVAGAKYAFAIENDWAIQLKPELRAALTYDWLNDSDAAIVDMPGVAAYRVEGEDLNRLGAELGAGVTLDYKGLKVTLMYDLDLHKDYTSQTGMIKFRGQF